MRVLSDSLSATVRRYNSLDGSTAITELLHILAAARADRNQPQEECCPEQAAAPRPSGTAHGVSGDAGSHMSADGACSTSSANCDDVRSHDGLSHGHTSSSHAWLHHLGRVVDRRVPCIGVHGRVVHTLYGWRKMNNNNIGSE